MECTPWARYRAEWFSGVGAARRDGRGQIVRARVSGAHVLPAHDALHALTVYRQPTRASDDTYAPLRRSEAYHGRQLFHRRA